MFGIPPGLFILLDGIALYLLTRYIINYRRRARSAVETEWVTCPYCLNPIRNGATRCQHCHADLSDDDEDEDDEE